MHHNSFLVDSFGRRINYLRISLTDRCNFRCVYCMPNQNLPVVARQEYLTKDQILRFVKVIMPFGVEHIRLTGGEPLLRDDIVDIVRGIKQIEGVRDLSLTTNGSRLPQFLSPLQEAGLDRINISLDSLGREGFQTITMTDDYKKVVQAIVLALEAEFPVKLNVVVLKDLNNHEIIDFANLAYEYPLEVRFLEFMPLCGSNWEKRLFLPIAHVRKLVTDHFDLSPEAHISGNVARVFKIDGGKGRVGFIGSLTESFCHECSRIRLTCDGKIRPCLFSQQEISVKELLREEVPDEKILETIRGAVRIKPQGNAFSEKPFRVDDEWLLMKGAMPYIRSIGG